MLSSPAHHGRGWIAVGALACGMHAAPACGPTTLRKCRRVCRALYRAGAGFNLGSPFSFSNCGPEKIRSTRAMARRSTPHRMHPAGGRTASRRSRLIVMYPADNE